MKLTKTEIIEWMRKNLYAKVSHWLFDENEYLYMKPDGKIYDECGNLFEDFHSLNRFNGMRIRVGDVWEKGWYTHD